MMTMEDIAINYSVLLFEEDDVKIFNQLIYAFSFSISSFCLFNSIVNVHSFALLCFLKSLNKERMR